MKKFAALALTAVLIMVLWIGLSLFIIGEPQDGKQLYTQCQWEGDRVTLHASTADSGVSLRGFQMEQEGRALHISCRKVLSSSFYPSGEYSANIDVSEIDMIVFGGEIIWSRF